MPVCSAGDIKCVMHCEFCQSMLTTTSQAGAHVFSGHFLFDHVTVDFCIIADVFFAMRFVILREMTGFSCIKR